MRVPRTLLWVASPLVVIGAVGVRWLVRRRRAKPGPGLADVDPSGLVGFGEGIDPDAVAEAHSALRYQREKLPRPGENLP